ncbi:hypothetical protein [uncultured Dialister sp.]|jgi:hypothetical protein|uniref:hypothetical protein n=1 Tax=uncultured Dialister sp. TaxID=278064 RepID=UPI002622C79E|nr:hypothetical protein [uncultured Dialister sp.]
MRYPFHMARKDKRGWLYIVRPHSGGYRGCYKKKGGQDWKAVPSLKAKDRDKAEGDLNLYAMSHGMKRII